MLKLFNTLSRKKEIFKPLKKKKGGMYTCGPTVYARAHIGNLRTYLFEDILKRVLEYNGYEVRHIMNITDVGHLTSDADTGEDKMEKGAREQKKTVWEIAKFYTKAFKNDIKRLNIKPPTIWLKATETIKEQIELIKVLEKKGFTYQIDDGIYFDTSKLKKYGRLWGSKERKIRPGARIEMVPGKKHTTDFALWKFTPAGVKRQMEWNAPWGKGFPGWHTECVVMAIKELGIPFDIHCGGIDHISIHHTNEIAQAEAAYGKILANYWLHGEFLVLKEKMSKSKGNIITLDTLIEKGFAPLAYRYLCLTAHYRSKLTFSWEGLAAAQNALSNLYNKTSELYIQQQDIRRPANSGTLDVLRYKQKFIECINNDLNIPNALALMWKMLDEKTLRAQEKHTLLLDFDRVFGLGLAEVKKEKIPKQILELAKQREELRQQKKWQEADKIRKAIQKLGWQIEDTEKGPNLKKVWQIKKT